MHSFPKFPWSLAALALLSLSSRGWPQNPSQDFDELQENAMKAAVARVGSSVVQIETSGGADILGSGPGMIRRGTGATTGVVVSEDGYVITSSFNFANKPSAIFVAVPGQRERLVATVVAADETRMI